MKVFLTGVAGDLGNYLCDNFVRDGFKVIGTDILPFDLLTPSLKEKLTGYYESDLLKSDIISSFIQKVFSDNKDISIIINNAGLKSFKILEDFDQKEFSNVLLINFLIPALITKESLQFFKSNNFGRIINIASNAGFEGYRKGSAYCSSKGALHLFTQSVSAELPGDITINTISPETFIFHAGFNKKNYNIPSGLIHPSRIYKQVRNIISGDFNGRVIPVLCFKSRVKYFLRDLLGSIRWLIR
jgi:NAD(P)-dependent dehydrogenase (short-subunit alcohol dehydrogenase family)